MVVAAAVAATVAVVFVVAVDVAVVVAVVAVAVVAVAVVAVAVVVVKEQTTFAKFCKNEKNLLAPLTGLLLRRFCQFNQCDQIWRNFTILAKVHKS